MSKRSNTKKKISEECWDLDMSFYRWLKKRLPIYLEEADKVVDLSYHIFTIQEKKMTQKEVINAMIKDLEFLTSKNVNDWSDEYADVRNHLMECWSKVLPAMWW